MPAPFAPNKNKSNKNNQSSSSSNSTSAGTQDSHLVLGPLDWPHVLACHLVNKLGMHVKGIVGGQTGHGVIRPLGPGRAFAGRKSMKKLPK